MLLHRCCALIKARRDINVVPTYTCSQLNPDSPTIRRCVIPQKTADLNTKMIHYAHIDIYVRTLGGTMHEIRNILPLNITDYS
jgi:hypothetical protein